MLPLLGATPTRKMHLATYMPIIITHSSTQPSPRHVKPMGFDSGAFVSVGYTQQRSNTNAWFAALYLETL